MSVSSVINNYAHFISLSDNFRTRDFEVDGNLGMFNNWGFESNLQFWTLFPHTPDNSFLGFVVEPSTSLANVSSKRNQAVIYGKEGWYSQGKEGYIDTIGETMQVHSTFKVGMSDSHSTFWMKQLHSSTWHHFIVRGRSLSKV